MFRLSLVGLCTVFSISANADNQILKEINKNLSALDQITDLSVLEQSQSMLADYDFSGIIRLSNCSASLVRLKDTSYTKALMLTNGHCMRRFQKPGEAIYNQPTTIRATLLNEDASKAGRLVAKKIVYATMTRTDMAILELNKTYEEIKNEYGIEPLIISSDAPQVGTDIEVISGYWRRGFSCAIENIVYNLKEDNWDFFDSIGYTKECKVYGGTSGSPVLSVDTGEVVAVNNTGSERGRKCTMNNPCEVNKNGDITTIRDKGYAQNTFWLYNCLDESSPEDLKLDFNREECKLLEP